MKVIDIEEKIKKRKQDLEKKEKNSKQEDLLKFIFTCLGRNELGDGELFALLHKKKFIYNVNLQEWMVWRGSFWEIDQMGEALQAVEGVVELYLLGQKYVEEQIEDAYKKNKKEDVLLWENVKKKIEKKIKRLRTKGGRENCLVFARTCKNALAVKETLFDVNPWLLACANGVIDLKTGLFRQGRHDEYLSKYSPIEYKGIEKSAPSWERFINEIFEEREDVVKYVQRLLGYAITGLSTEHLLFVLYGQGRNGKSVLVETICYVLGNLAGPIQAELLLDQGRTRNSSGPSPDIMSLKGLRIAIASETEAGRKISSSQVKRLTGGDSLRGRNPHDKFETVFKPTHTLFLLTNNKPHAPADDFAFWERIHLIPFNVSFVDRDPEKPNERRQDKNLFEKLKQEASGILAWLVKGCLLYQEEGLNPPALIKEATKEYRRDEDVLADFIEECCILEEDYKEDATALYSAFSNWWEENIGKRIPSKRSFGLWMGKKFEKIRSGGGTYYVGIRVL